MAPRAWRRAGLAIIVLALGCVDSGAGADGAGDAGDQDAVGEPSDAAPEDASGADASGTDGSRADASGLDASAVDGAPSDGAVRDAADPDASAPDATDPDASAPDALPPDAPTGSCGCEVSYPAGGELVDREVLFDMDGDGILERADIGPRPGFPGLEVVRVYREGAVDPIVLEDYCGLGGGCSGPLAIYPGHDIDGDGTEELLVHKPDDFSGGVLWVHFGSPTGVGINPGRGLGTGDGEWTGRSQAAADFNGDGRADIAVLDIASRYRRNGAITIFYGAPAPTLLTAGVTLGGTHQIERLAGDHDCNDDGYPDLVLRNTTASPVIDQMFAGGPGGLGGSPSCTSVPPPRPSFSCGCEYTPYVAGETKEIELDVDGDAVMDRAVVVLGSSGGLGGTGQRIEVYLGGSAVPTVLEQGCGDAGGYCPESLSIYQGHDVNGDGADDLLVHGTSDDSAGHLAVYLGSATGLVSPAAIRLTGTDRVEQFGRSAPGADLNADGYADVVYARPYDWYTTVGSVGVLFGGPAPGTLTTGTIWNYSIGADPLSMTHPATQDCNDDGVPDLVLGRPYSGKYTVHAGGPGGPSVAPTCTYLVE